MLKTLFQEKNKWREPLLYLLICVLAFGLFIPVLGFYWDDWPTIFYTHSGRAAQLANHFSYDRPFSVWGYWLVGRLGTAPITWHLAALLIRWAIVLAFAWALKPLWPRQSRNITLLAILFAIYPGYYLQPSSVIFSSHLLALLFFLISFGSMARAVTDRKNSRAYSVVAILATIIHMFTLEYFVGLEMVRPFYLWLVVANNSLVKRERLKHVLRIWIPYVVIGFIWVSWRLFWLKLPAEPYPLTVLTTLKTNPLAGLANLISASLQDIIYILTTAWTQTLQPNLFQLSSWIDYAIWILVAISFTLLYFALESAIKKSKRSPATDQMDRQYSIQSMTLGLLALVAGLLPVWVIGEQIARGDYNLRYILVGMFGAALFVGSAIIYFVPNYKHRVLIVSLLVALAIGMHLRAANDYRLDWEAQRSFYWQLYWRAPDIETNTALVSFDHVTKYLGDPMTGNALNVLYPVSNQPPSADLWNFELNRTQTVNSIEEGEILENDYRGLTFRAQSPDSLVFYIKPEGGCLWLLAPINVDNEYLPFENRELVARSNLASILPTPENIQYPDPTVFGGEPQHDWCYYFEKADLARQYAEWIELLALMDEAKNLELGPNIGIEWLPLIEAYGTTGDWDLAVELSREVHGMHTRNDSMLCATWEAMVERSNDDENSRTAFQQVSTMAACDSTN
jgi:hypothetical protein